jgi:hypothetical protein
LGLRVIFDLCHCPLEPGSDISSTPG